MHSLICYGCRRTLEPTSQMLHEDGTLDTYPGELFTMIDGRPWCESCRLAQLRECQPVATVATAAHDTETPTSLDQEIQECWWEQTHPYLPPGCHGGGSSGRFRRRKTGTAIPVEEWGS